MISYTDRSGFHPKEEGLCEANARVWGVQSPSSSREDHFSKIGKVWSPGESCAKQVIRPLWENLALIGICTLVGQIHTAPNFFRLGAGASLEMSKKALYYQLI